MGRQVGQQCAGRGLAGYQRGAQRPDTSEQQARGVRGKRGRVEVVELGSQRGRDRSGLVPDDAASAATRSAAC